MHFRQRRLPAIAPAAAILAWSAVLLAWSAPAADPPAATAADPAPAITNSPWQRVVLIGASVSAGFTLSEPLGGSNTPQYRLSRYLDAAILAPHEPVRNLGVSMFFLRPEPLARGQLAEALRARPSLVVGVDFLFWFCYGEAQSDQERLQRFELGLSLLETVSCPLLVGDIPDASAAAESVLWPGQIPSAQVMAAANRRLREWAASRPNVAVVPVSAFMRSTMANQAITIRNRTLPSGKTRGLLQDDLLHPSTQGCAVLALAIADALLAHQPGFSPDDIRWDPAEVLRLAAVAPPEQAGK